MGQFLGIAHFIGIFVAWFVFYRRSGLADIKACEGIDWREFLIPNPMYFLATWIQCMFWEIPLLLWLVTGRPESPWRATTEMNGRPARSLRRGVTS